MDENLSSYYIIDGPHSMYSKKVLEKKKQCKRSGKQIKLRQIFDLQSSQAKDLLCIQMYIDACHYEPPLIYDWLQSLKRLKSILTSLENFSWWAETQLHELLIRVPKVVMFQKKYCVDLKLHADIGMLNPCIVWCRFYRVPFKSLLRVQIKQVNVKIPFAYLQENKNIKI